MNALQLYNYGVIPDKKKSLLLPQQKKQKTTSKVKEVIYVEYICHMCKKTIKLNINENIKCNQCESRILLKEKQKTPQQYMSI